MSIFTSIIKWFETHFIITVTISSISFLVLAGTIIIISVIIIFLPDDYFVKYGYKHNYLLNKHPFLSYIVLFIKNFFGILCVLIGIILLFLPGQGILTIFIGITFIDFPKKKLLIIYFVKKEKIYKIINRLRKKFNKPHLIIPK